MVQTFVEVVVAPLLAAVATVACRAGMVGFVAFCEIIAVLIVPAGLWAAFATATLAALVVQSVTAYLPAGEGSLAARPAR